MHLKKSIHKFGYSAESLQKDKIEKRGKELELQPKIIILKLKILFKSISQENGNNYGSN